MTTLHRYSAYGLSIHSELELPELAPSDRLEADLTIIFEPLPHCVPPGPSLNYRLEVEPRWFVWRDLGRFELRDLRVLAIDPDPGVTNRYLSFAILGPIIAYVLHVRGALVLHASAIGIDGACAAFIAEKGVGKSTTAAMCLQAGYEPVADDVLGVTFTPKHAIAAPGFALVKLKHDAGARFALKDAAIMAEPRPNFSKRQHRLNRDVSMNSLQVERVYLLKRGDCARTTTLPATEAFKALLQNAYISLYARRRAFVSGADQTRLMRQCAELSAKAKISILEAPQGLDRINDVLAALAEDWRKPRPASQTNSSVCSS